MPDLVFENTTLRYQIDALGRNRYFGWRERDINIGGTGTVVAAIRKAGKDYPATFTRGTADGMQIGFGDSGITAELAVRKHPRYVIIEVLQVSDPAVDELVFLDVPLQAEQMTEQGLAACALALNVRTKVEGIPGNQDGLRATAFRELDMVGAQVAIMVCRRDELRELLKTVVKEAPELPPLTQGGPWALDTAANRGSYVFDRGVTEANVDEYIRVLRALGVTQLNIYGRYRAYRHGDFAPNHELYPQGRTSMQAVIDRLHAAGFLAGFHSLSFAIDKASPWVTPVPDPRLAKDAVFTLSKAIGTDTTVIPVNETLDQVTTQPTSRDDNSVTLQIDEELIVFQAVERSQGWAFAQCQRAALGTKAQPHRAGAMVYRLAKVWGNFVPDGHSSLLVDVAAAAADLVNACGFNMTYFDGLDGADRLGKASLRWYYSARFVYEFYRRLQRPVLLEMSEFHHHLWVVRSRIGAWDYPTKNYKRFVDHHLADNRQGESIMLPAQLGWWSGTIDSRWMGIQGERMFPEYIEYWCGKALATNAGISLVGADVSPDCFFASPANQTAARIIRDYETIRRAGNISSGTRTALAEPGAEFKLTQSPDGKNRFQRVTYEKQILTLGSDRPAGYRIVHKGRRQAIMLRLEPLFSLAPYDAPDGMTLTDFSSANEFGESAANPGFQSRLTAGREANAGMAANRGHYEAWRLPSSERPSDSRLVPAWTRTSKRFTPPINLFRPEADQTADPVQSSDWAARTNSRQLESGHRLGLGFWVEGDDSGAVLNVQLRSPRHIRGVADHYVVLNFNGRRYVELVETESERIEDYAWPYSSHLYCIFRDQVDFKQIEYLNLWLNKIPAQGVVSARLSAIRALPLIPILLRRPTLRIRESLVALPMDIGTGDYVELDTAGSCQRYDAQGELVETVALAGGALCLEPGENSIEIAAETGLAGVTARMRLTVMRAGEYLE